MGNNQYICWGDDKEDLKQQIIDQLYFNPDDYSAVKTKARKIKNAWRVNVKCSQGHENVFEGEVWVTPEEKVEIEIELSQQAPITYPLNEPRL